VISGGPGKTVVPNEVGKRLDEARSDLRSHGFQVSVTYVDTPPGQEGGMVVDQNPQEGDSVNRGSTITLTVSRSQQQPPTGGPTFPSFPPGGGGGDDGN
jgi:eukaryotic-like serine/threonine-protein kinase